LQATSQLTRDHAGIPKRIEISPRVGLIAPSAKLGKLQSEGGKLSYLVVELIDASLDGLDAVELDWILRQVSRSKGIEFEVIAELRHRCAQRQQVTAHVAHPVADLGLQRPRTVRVVRLERSRSRIGCRHAA
jgi:hypothetical protein